MVESSSAVTDLAIIRVSGINLAAQLGNVIIEDDVEIGSNSTVDRASYDSTTVGIGTKIDNLVMVGHNCQIGKHNLLCGQVGIAGSTVTGDYVVNGRSGRNRGSLENW